MLLSLSWLREFVPYEGTAQELADKLTMLGLEAEGIFYPHEALKPLVVGHVVSCEKHAETDHLSICQVDVGDEILTIVCGAANVAKDLKVAVIKAGSRLPDGTLIKKTKLRGIPSNGMICSERELGLSEDHEGIMELNSSLAPGTPLFDALPLEQEVLDISITPNRGDCLSVLGFAREVALSYNLPLTMPKVNFQETNAKARDLVSISIKDTERCPLYLGRILEGGKTAKSPDWIRYRLAACGVRAISNFVDATNYTMLELGQPLHAFDLDTIKGGSIIISGAKQGEKATTLDAQNHTLENGDIVITDSHNILALGGVMGGLHSEVTEKTSRIFLEGAVFAPWQVRRTVRRLGFTSDAAFRFERGTDPAITAVALDRAASIMAQTSGATVLAGYTGNTDYTPGHIQIPFTIERAEKLIGVSLTEEFCKKTLTGLRCEINATNPVWEITPPTARPDLTREADIIEELARVYGVDNIPAIIPAVSKTLDRAGLPKPKHLFLQQIKHWAAEHAALFETINYSFTGHKLLDLLQLPQEGRIQLQNPLSEDLDTMRTHLAPGILTAVGVSLAQSASSIRVFEVANVFSPNPDSDTKATESPRLAIALTGNRNQQVWSATKGDMGYADVKGIIEQLCHHLGIQELVCDLNATAPYLLPAVSLIADGENIGFTGQVATHCADHFNARKPIWYAELDLDVLYKISQKHCIRFAPLATYPAIRRDITFITPTHLKTAEIITAIKELRIKILENVSLIDCFEPKGKDERNLTFRLTFRSPTKTLKETEADKQRDIVANKITELLPVRM